MVVGVVGGERDRTEQEPEIPAEDEQRGGAGSEEIGAEERIVADIGEAVHERGEEEIAEQEEGGERGAGGHVARQGGTPGRGPVGEVVKQHRGQHHERILLGEDSDGDGGGQGDEPEGSGAAGSGAGANVAEQSGEDAKGGEHVRASHDVGDGLGDDGVHAKQRGGGEREGAGRIAAFEEMEAAEVEEEDVGEMEE